MIDGVKISSRLAIDHESVFERCRGKHRKDASCVLRGSWPVKVPQVAEYLALEYARSYPVQCSCYAWSEITTGVVRSCRYNFRRNLAATRGRRSSLGE